MKILFDPVVIISVLFHGLSVVKVVYLTLFLNFDLFQKFVEGSYLCYLFVLCLLLGGLLL